MKNSDFNFRIFFQGQYKNSLLQKRLQICLGIFPEWIQQVVGRKLFDGLNEVVDLCFPWPAVAEELSMDVLLWEVLSGQVDGGLRPLSGRFAQKIAHDIDQQFLFGVKTVKY